MFIAGQNTIASHVSQRSLCSIRTKNNCKGSSTELQRFSWKLTMPVSSEIHKPMEIDYCILGRLRRSLCSCLTKITHPTNCRSGLHMPNLALQKFGDGLKEENSNNLVSCQERTSMPLSQIRESPNIVSGHVRLSKNLARSSSDNTTSDSSTTPMVKFRTKRGTLGDEERSLPSDFQEHDRTSQTMESNEPRVRPTHSDYTKPSSLFSRPQAQALGRPRNRILELAAVYDLLRQDFRILFDLNSLKRIFRIPYDLYLISSSFGKHLLGQYFKYLRMFILLISWIKLLLLALELYQNVEEKAAQIILFSKTFDYVASFHLNQLQEVCSIVPVLWELFLTFSIFVSLTLQIYPLAAIMIATTSYHIHKFHPTRKD